MTTNELHTIEAAIATERANREAAEVRVEAKRRLANRRRREDAAERAAALEQRDLERYATDLEAADLPSKVRDALAGLAPTALLHPFKLPRGTVVAFTDAAEAEPYRTVGGAMHGGRLVNGRRLVPLRVTSAAHAARSWLRTERVVAVDPTAAELARLA